MRCYPRHMHLPAPQVDEKQNIIRHEPAQRPDLGREKVGGYQHIQMRTEKLLPRGRRLALWGRRNAMALEDVAHRLVTDRIAQVHQGSDNAVIAPRTVLLGHTDHQGFEVLIDLRSTWSLTLFGAIKLLRHKFAMPGENGIGFDDVGHFLEGLLAQLLADLGQRRAFAIRQPHKARHGFLYIYAE